MFRYRHLLSCSDCSTEYRFKTVKEQRAFKLGSKARCPECGGYLSFSPLCDYTLTLPPKMEMIPRKINVVNIGQCKMQRDEAKSAGAVELRFNGSTKQLVSELRKAIPRLLSHDEA